MERQEKGKSNKDEYKFEPDYDRALDGSQGDQAETRQDGEMGSALQRMKI